jgi:hypothetical protein
MKASKLISALLSYLFLAGGIDSMAANTALNISLSTPQLQTLQTSIPVESQTVEVSLHLLYNTRGQITCTSDSTVDGMPATCLGTMTKRGTNISYALTIKSATVPPTVIVLRGSPAGPASCTYAGPKGHTKIAAQPVTITSVAPAPAHIDISSMGNIRNQISGTGNIVAYGTNSSVPGKLRGVVSTTKLLWSLAQPPRVVSFKGNRSNDVYAGSLKVTIPPARETIQPFEILASAFPVSSGIATFRGTVLLGGSNALPTAAAGVKVTIKSDINGDGKFLGKESASAMTDAQGHYQVAFPVLLGRPVMLEMSKAGYAKYMTAYPDVAPAAVVIKNNTLQSLNSLSVSQGTAQSTDGKITLMGLPSNISSVDARVFNPNTEAAQFPGEFADDQNNLLVSSVFSAIEAKDSRGSAVTNLGANTMLCMEIPRDTWSTMGDLTPGNSQIDIPLYFYDEASGEWKRNAANGWLEDPNHVKISEAQLASIQNGSYSGRVYGAGPITHLSYWNVDWPIDSHTCIRGIIVDSNNIPVTGANVTVKGLTYTGSTSASAQSDGAFCVEIMRSEGPAEDLDRDGVPGETQQVQILVSHGGNFYTFGPFNSPQAQATCDTGGGLDISLLRLIEASRLTATVCTVTGRMVYSGTAQGGTSTLNAGDPIGGATVYGFDSEAVDLLSQCLGDGTCIFGTTDANGNFSFNTVILSSLTVYGTKTETVSQGAFNYYFGTGSFTGCPLAPITLSADLAAVRQIVLNLTGNNVDSGVLSFVNGVAVVSLLSGANTYVGTSNGQVNPPTSVGQSVTLNMINANTSQAAGTVTFTVTSLSPLTGTWTTSAVGLNGTFTQETFGQ